MASSAGAFQLANMAPPEPDPPAPASAEQPSVPALPESPVVTHEATTTPGETHAAHKPGLPQLDVGSFAGQLFWLALSLLFMFVVVWRVAAPKIGGVIAARAGRIKGDIDSAAEAKRKSEDALAAYEKALADARSRALKIGEEMRGAAQAEGEAKSAAQAQRVAADTAKAEARIAEMRKQAMASVSTLAADVASDIVGKLTGEKVAAGDVSAAVAKALKSA
jgi:F-type H+-transporting ATPase subunit b